MAKKVARTHDGDNTHIRAIADDEAKDVQIHTAAGGSDADLDDDDWSPFAAFGDEGGSDDSAERDAFKALMLGLLMGDVPVDEYSEQDALAQDD